MHGLQNGVETSRDIGGGEQRGQDVHTLTQLSARTVGFTTVRRSPFHVHVLVHIHVHVYKRRASLPAAVPAETGCATGRRASTDAPPLTRSPGFTWMAASRSNRTSTREPNLMSPTRWPRATWSPTLKLKTMRRAIRPAICLNTKVRPSPSTVTMFCSFSSADCAAMALRNLPR